MIEHSKKLAQFLIDDKFVTVQYIETQTVKDGVECDVYAFPGDDTKALAIVRVREGCKTPLQKVLLGEKTIEGLVSGSGMLTIDSVTYEFGSDLENEEIIVAVGQTMQWHANGEDDLTFYEICEPPYSDGRFENLTE